MPDINNTVSPNLDEETIKRINDLCAIILVNEDKLNTDSGKKYIEDQINSNIAWCGDENQVRFYVLNNLSNYIDSCPSPVQLFAFASNNNFYRFRMNLVNHYFQYYYSRPGTHDSIEFPKVLNYVLDCIQEAIDTHTLFQKFSIKMSNDIADLATKEATAAAEEAAITAKLAASKAANEAIDIVIEQVMDDKHVEAQISDKVNQHMEKVTSRVSESSVTILGIFSGIVLTVVAGLFYSSSVIENVNSANFFRLLGVSALVGLICLHLIAVMFRFIGKMSGKEPPRDRLILFVSIVLIVVMIAGFVLQFVFPTSSSETDINISDVDANIDVSFSSGEEPSIDSSTTSEQKDPK